MDAEITRNTLIHNNPGMPKEDFMAEIDATGGWINGYKYVAFYHADTNAGRVCKFTNDGINGPWWTVVCTSDDYYWWKISDAKKKEFATKIKRQVVDYLRTSFQVD